MTEIARNERMGLRTINLWSWLTKSETRKDMYCPTDLQVTIEQFKQELEDKLKADRLPANIELCEIQWDNSNIKQQRIVVTYNTVNQEYKIVNFLVGIDVMGNYSYIEEKVNILPPILPKPPRENKNLNSSEPTFRILGILFIGVGVTGSLFGEVGGMLPLILGILFIIVSSGTNNNAKEWNREAASEKAAWDEALLAWERKVMAVAFSSNTDDIMGRFLSAVSNSVKQVRIKLFDDRNAELRNESEQKHTQKEIEDELAKRRKDFK